MMNLPRIQAKIILLFQTFIITWSSVSYGPSDQTIAVHSPVILACRTSDVISSVWTFRAINTNVSQAIVIGESLVSPEENDVRSINTQDGGYNLEISKVDLKHEGLYGCQLRTERREATLTIEVSPNVTISSEDKCENCRKMNVEENTFTIFHCSALDAKPAVSLDWYLDGVHQKTLANERIKTGLLTSTTSSIKLSFDRGHKELTCKAKGQKIKKLVSATLSLNILYKPECTLHLDLLDVNVTAMCRCSANPIVEESNYVIYVNSSIAYPGSQLVLVQPSYETEISCAGGNVVGNHTSKPHTIFYYEQMQYTSTPDLPTSSIYTPSDAERTKREEFIIFIAIAAVVFVLILFTIACVCKLFCRRRSNPQEKPEYQVIDPPNNYRVIDPMVTFVDNAVPGVTPSNTDYDWEVPKTRRSLRLPQVTSL